VIKSICSFISKGFPMNIDPKEHEKVIEKTTSVIEIGSRFNKRNIKQKIGEFNGKSII